MGRSLRNTGTHSKSSALTPENAWSERWSRDSNMYLLSMVRKCETWDSFRAIRLCISNWIVAPALCRCGHVALTVRTPNGSRRKETQMSSFRASIDEDWGSDPVPMISGLSHAVYVPVFERIRIRLDLLRSEWFLRVIFMREMKKIFSRFALEHYALEHNVL